MKALMLSALLAAVCAATTHAAAQQAPGPGAAEAPHVDGPTERAPGADAQDDAEEGGRPALPRREWVGPRPEQDFACRYSGGEAQQGETRCISRSSCEIVTARCERRANNAVWITLEEGCDVPVS